MPKIVNIGTNVDFNTTTDHTVKVPTGTASGDLLVMIVSKNTTDAFSTWPISGWTSIANSFYDGDRYGVAYKTAGVSESDVTVSDSGATSWASIMYAIQGHTGNPALKHASATTNASNIGTGTAVTPTAADSLLLYVGKTTTDNYGLIKSPIYEYDAYLRGDTTALTCYHTFSVSTSTIPAAKWYYGFNIPFEIVVEVQDDGVSSFNPPILTGGIDTPLNMMHYNGGHTSELNAPTISGTIEGRTITSATAVAHLQQGSFGSATYAFGFRTNISTTNTYGRQINFSTHGTTQDYSSSNNSFFLINLIPAEPLNHISYGDVDEPGVVVVLIDTAGDWKAYAVDGSDNINKIDGPGQRSILIDPNASTHLKESGTFDLTIVDRVAVFVNPIGVNNEYHYVSHIYTINPWVLLGGTSATPASLVLIEEYQLSAGAKVLQNLGSTYVLQGIVEIGDGSSDVYNQEQDITLSFETLHDATAKKIGFHSTDNFQGLSFDLTAASTVDWDNVSVGGVDPYHFNITDAVGATLTFDSVSITNAGTIDIGSEGTFTDCTFDTCGEITSTGATLTTSTIKDSAASKAIVVTTQADFEALQGTTFSGNAYSIQITGNHGGETWDGTGMTVSGGTGSYDIQYTGTGTLTISMDTGSGFSTGRAEATVGTLTISSPTVTLTVNSNVASSDIKIFTENTQTVVASATGTTASTTTAATYDWTVQKAGYLPQRGTGVTLGASSVTVDVELVEDPVYNASHGLTFTTDYSYAPATRIMTIVANQEGRDLYSAMIDDFISESALYNVPFPLKAIGPDRIDFQAVGKFDSDTTVGATIDSGDITFWKGAGMEWEHDTTGNPTKKFYSIKSSNTLQASSVVGYTQVNNGTPAEATLVSNQVNQVIQFYNDVDGDGAIEGGDGDYEYTGHLVFKGFLTGYYQARWDVINDGGITTLEPYEYTIALTQDAIAGTTGDQTITITTLTDHSASPLSVGGKSFNFELVDPGTNTAEDLLAQHNYNVYNAVNTLITTALYTSYTAFDVPDLIVEAGSTYETEAGFFEGEDAVTDQEGVYLSRSSADHPNITRFQSNDLSYYTPAVTANGTITGLVDAGAQADDRLQIENTTALSASDWAATTAYSAGDMVKRTSGLGSENTAGLFFRCTTGGTSGGSEPTWVISTPGVFGTTGSETTDNTVTWECFAVLLYDADPAATSWSDSYIDGEEFASGETGTYRFAEMDEGTTFKTGSATFITTSSGFTVAASLSADSVFAANGLDGSAYETTFSPDFTNDYIVLDTNTDFSVISLFAYYAYQLTTSDGMYNFWGGITAIDDGNYRNNTSVVRIDLDESGGFVKQTDSARFFNDVPDRPAIDPTTGGNGLEVNWRNPVYVQNVGGSALTTAESTMLLTTLPGKVDTADTAIDAVQADLDNGTDGLGAIKTAVDGISGGGGATASEVFDEALKANLVTD